MIAPTKKQHVLPAGAAAAPEPQALLLHGFTGAAADWAALGLGTPALAIDLPGHAGSPGPTAADAGCFDAELRRLLAALPASIDRLVGYSLGGRIALGLLRLAPERFRAATIISAHPGLTDPAERAARRAADGRWSALLRTSGIDAFVDAWEAQPLFASQAKVPPRRLAEQRRRRRAHAADALAWSLDCFGLGVMPPAWEAVAAWRGRLRWITGGADPKFTAIGCRISEMRPATALQVLPGIGHNPLLEAPEKIRQSIESAA